MHVPFIPTWRAVANTQQGGHFEDGRSLLAGQRGQGVAAPPHRTRWYRAEQRARGAQAAHAPKRGVRRLRGSRVAEDRRHAGAGLRSCAGRGQRATVTRARLAQSSVGAMAAAPLGVGEQCQHGVGTAISCTYAERLPMPLGKSTGSSMTLQLSDPVGPVCATQPVGPLSSRASGSVLHRLVSAHEPQHGAARPARGPSTEG